MIQLNKKNRVAIAMSGGVDSSVAASLLKEAGYEVIGFTMQLWPRENSDACCGVKAIHDASRVARELGIPHYILDGRAEFQKKIIDPFYKDYENGLTPNPCIRCNEFIKFDYLLNKAKELDAKLATGHYARIEFDPESREYKLKKGIDPSKDQSYTLYRLNQEQLSASLFPLGNLTKEKIREIARSRNIHVAEKQESQDLCFQDKSNFRELLAAHAPSGTKAGNIVNTKGEILGRHQGIAFYTIGQRRRLGIAARRPLYVLSLRAKENEVVVGFEEELAGQELSLNNTHFISTNFREKAFEISAKIRYASPEVGAKVFCLRDKTLRVVFNQPQKAITPGQSVVFYRKDEVIGGGIIKKQ